MDVLPLKIDSLMILQSHPKKVVEKYAKKGMRISGRAFDQTRTFELHKHVEILKNYTLTKCGNSVVLVWVRLELSDRRLDADKGYFIPQVKLPRIQNKPHFERLENAFTFIEMLEDHIEKWNVIDLKDLKINDSHCWCLYADITILNDDGNIYPVIWKGLASCLEQTRIPELEDLNVIGTGDLLKVNPIEITKVVNIGEFTLSDPDKREEDNCDSYTICSERNGKPLWISGAMAL